MGLSDIHRNPGLGRGKQRHLFPSSSLSIFIYFSLLFFGFWLFFLCVCFIVLFFFLLTHRSPSFHVLVREDNPIEPR